MRIIFKLIYAITCFFLVSITSKEISRGVLISIRTGYVFGI